MTPQFSQGMPRWAVLLAAIAAFCAIPPEVLARGPDMCLWRHLFHLTACPACGSTRALAAFFHGRFAEALAFNRNVLVTAPLLLSLLALDLYHLARRYVVGGVASARSSWRCRRQASFQLEFPRGNA